MLHFMMLIFMIAQCSKYVLVIACLGGMLFPPTPEGRINRNIPTRHAIYCQLIMTQEAYLPW